MMMSSCMSNQITPRRKIRRRPTIFVGFKPWVTPLSKMVKCWEQETKQGIQCFKRQLSSSRCNPVRNQMNNSNNIRLTELLSKILREVSMTCTSSRTQWKVHRHAGVINNERKKESQVGVADEASSIEPYRLRSFNRLETNDCLAVPIRWQEYSKMLLQRPDRSQWYL